MSYSQFKLKELKSQFGLKILEEEEIFSNLEPVQPSSLLREILARNLPLALRIDTEKARSEMIVAQVLIELREIFQGQISLFSGREFDIDQSQGLNGTCDFLISHSPEQLSVEAPAAILVEAKNDNIRGGIPQCLAEMVAARVFNDRENNTIPCIYGGVTTGSIWKFLKLEKNLVYLEKGEHHINDIDSLFAILVHIVETSRPTSPDV
ncbi:MAG: hypothetical protein F6J93_13245 [Oscillatoria sp. SIO1A7]|nr:hypothetical protein [Oscillatoria sp. SIO1A7]